MLVKVEDTPELKRGNSLNFVKFWIGVAKTFSSDKTIFVFRWIFIEKILLGGSYWLPV
jgi:hypothetical protein